jgi:hypothetical protein
MFRMSHPAVNILLVCPAPNVCVEQVTLAVFISICAHVLHGVYKPWCAGSQTYYIQHLSLFATTFVFIMGLLFKVRLCTQQTFGGVDRLNGRHQWMGTGRVGITVSVLGYT